MKKHVILYRKIPQALLARMQSEFDVTCLENLKPPHWSRFLEALETADGLLGAGFTLTPELLDRAPRLRVISTISAGIDHYDIDYLGRRGILLTNTPDAPTEATADLIFALILATARRITELSAFVKDGRWKSSIAEDMFGVDVHGKTIGIIGMGRIGLAVARRARLGFGMRVMYHNRSAVHAVEGELGAERVHLDALLSGSDFICVTLPLTPDTRQLIGRREFSLMQPGAIFINGSRGGVVDEGALIEALTGKTIRAAGLDVFEREPLSPASPLLDMPNVIVTPHTGSATHDTRFAMARAAVEDMTAALLGLRPRHPVNPAAWQERVQDRNQSLS